MEHKKKKVNKDIVYFDFLNIAACLAVVAMHHNSIVMHYERSSAWAQSLVFEVLCYWAVPCFFMMSGAKLLTYRERYDTKTFLKKRIIKLMIPFVFWNTFVLFFREFFGTPVLQSHSIGEIISSVINYAGEPTFYFFPAIISMYIAMPVLSLLVDNRKILWYIVSAVFIIQSLLPTLFGIIGIEVNDFWGTGFTIRVMYIVLGYLLSTENFTKKNKNILYICAALAAVFRYLYIFVGSNKSGELNMLLFNSSYFPGVLLSIGVFLFFKEKFGKVQLKGKSREIIKTVSGCTFGIYIIHKVFVMPIERAVLGLSVDSLLWRTAMILVTYLVSLIIIWVMKHIPIINKLVP